MPSPEYVRGYNQRASRMRMGAWIATGSAAAGLGGALLFNSQAEKAYREFQPLRQSLADQGWNETDHQRLTELAATGRANETRAYVSAGVAGAAAIAGAYFWIAGDDPGRYRHLQLAVVPSPRTSLVALSGRF
jgi:hypothetical protein